MSTLDWPTSREFQPATMTWGATTPRTRWAAPYTGQVQSISHVADRLRCSLVLPPCTAAQAGPREAFFMAAARSGDWLRVPHWQRPAPLGTLRGSPLINAIAAAGATSVVLKNCRPQENLLLVPEAFDLTPWSGTAAATANTTAAPDGTTTADTITDDSAVVTETRSQAVTVANDTTSYTASVYVRKTSGGTAPTFALNLAFGGGTVVSNTMGINTDTGAVLLTFGGNSVEDAGDYWRLTLVRANNGSGNTTMTMTVYPAFAAYGASVQDVTQTGSAIVWGAMVNTGTAALTYAGQPTLLGGDIIKVGSQLLPVGYAGATCTAEGLMTVPLVLPLRAAVAVNDAVTWSAPTATMQLLNVEPTFTYAPPGLQGGLEIELSEVFA